MKAKRICAFVLALMLLMSLLPTAFAEEQSAEALTEATEEPAAIAELEEAATRSVTKTKAYLLDCSQMDFVMNTGTRQGFHYFDSDGKSPWEYENIIYCLENDKSFSYGSGHTGVDGLTLEGTSSGTHAESVWYGLSSDERMAIGLILLYGAPNQWWDDTWGFNAVSDHNQHNPNIGYRFATQALIWEIVCDMRDPLPPYERTSDYWYTRSVGCCMSKDGTVDYFLQAYNGILQSLRLHNVIPSFTGDFLATAPVIEIKGNQVTVTDSNGVLSRFAFTNTDSVSYSKSGNDLTIKTSGAVPTDAQSAVAELPDPTASIYEAWYNSFNSSKQVCIRVSLPASDPVPAYFKLKRTTSELSIVKVTEDGKNLASWNFGIYSDQACTKLLSGPHTTDSNGKIAAANLTPGTVWVKELGNSDAVVSSQYYCSSTNPQQVTLVAGETATVSFSNQLSLGTCQIVKTATNGGTVAGWHFTVTDSTGAVVGEYVTDDTGTISLSLTPGTYTVAETDSAAEYWINDPTPSKTVTVSAGQTAAVTFTNQWLGKTKIIKTLGNPEDGSMEGWDFSVHKVNADNTTERIGSYTTGADGTIVLDLEPAQYRVTELLPEDSQWQCISSLSRDITVTAGQTAAVTFTNALRPGKIILHKVNTQGQALEGVIFHLEWYDSGVWKSVRYSSSPVSKPGYCSTRLQNGRLTTDENGMAVYEGLHPDTQYRLTEVAALDGYQLLAEPVYIDGLPDTLTVELNVVNVRTYELPATGGKPIVFTVLPLAAAACFAGGLLLLMKRRRK